MSRLRNRRFLSPVDTAWLRMDDPTNLMMITGVFLFDQPLEFERLKQLIMTRLLKYDRFSQRAVHPPLGLSPPYWEDDPNFDLRAHLHRIALPAPGNQEALQKLVNDYMSMPLDYSKPLWQFHLVEGYNDGCALLCRLHHCIADGIALVRVLLDMTDEVADPPVKSRVSSADSSHQPHLRGDAVTDPIASFLNTPRKLARKIIQESMKTVTGPTRLRDTLKFGTDSSAALAHLLLLSPDPVTPFKGKLGVRKGCAWTKPVALEDIKAIGRVTGGTVNDVLLSTVSGALGRYLQHLGEPIGGLNIRAVVPVNLRPPDEPLKLGNAFGLVFLSLPIGIQDPLDRLNELKRRMDGIKGTPEAIVAYGILVFMGATNAQVENIVVDIFQKKATTVMTNVPGPKEIRYFAGKPIRGIMFWVPQSGRLGIGVSIISYAGEVLIGVACDAGLIPEPQKLIDHIYNEIDDLMELVALADQTDNEPALTKNETTLCQAITKRGRPCKNPPLSNSSFCHIHQH